jgi:predicted Zn-dependent peptidase
MYEENPMMHIDDLLEQSMFEGSTLGWSIAGPTSVIARIKRAELMAYKKKYYQPANMTVVVAGKLHPNIQKLISRYFGIVKNEHKIFATSQPAKQTPLQVKVQTKETEQTQLAVAFPAYDYNHPRLTTLEVLSTILGGSMSSRLFIQVREKLGLCYYIRSSTTSYSDTGTLAIQTGVSTKRVQEALQAMFKEVKKIKREHVSREELDRAKEYMKGRLVLQMEASERLAQWFAHESLFMKSVKRPEDRLKELESVTTHDIHEVANDILDFKKISSAGIGPFSKQQLSSLLSTA